MTLHSFYWLKCLVQAVAERKQILQPLELMKCLTLVLELNTSVGTSGKHRLYMHNLAYIAGIINIRMKQKDCSTAEGIECSVKFNSLCALSKRISIV